MPQHVSLSPHSGPLIILVQTSSTDIDLLNTN